MVLSEVPPHFPNTSKKKGDSGRRRLLAAPGGPCLTLTMTRLLLLRHAESEWNAQGRWQGVADPPLSARGERQAARAGELLRGQGISSAVSSDLIRARTTATILARALGMPGPVGVDADLREYDVGAWSGLTRDEIEARWPGAIDQWRSGRLEATPGGEKRSLFVARITAAASRAAAARPGQNTLVITHGGLIGALARSLGADPGRVPHLAGRWIDATPAGLEAGPTVCLLVADATPTSGDDLEALSPSGVMDTGRR